MGSWRRRLVGSWTHRGPLAVLLWPASVLYGSLAALHRLSYRIGIRKPGRVAVPVVVVGNVVAGGAGKTPVVLELVRHLLSRGHRPGVVSRGYGRRGAQCREVLDDSLPGEVGDEPLLIRQSTKVPVFVAGNRLEAARAMTSAFPALDVVVCDDGLQHHALQRDIEICVFDEVGVGNGLLLPAGPLREPWPRATDLVLAAPKSAVTGFAVRRELASHARRADGTRLALQDLQSHRGRTDGPLWAIAGIARPENFFAMLRARGLPLARTLALPDHADFAANEWSNTGGQTLLCTEKDASKLWLHRPDAWAVPLVLEIDPGFWSAFDSLLAAALKPKLSSGHGHTTS